MANKTWKASLACGAAVIALGTADAAAAQQRTFNIPAESAIDSIPEFARQAGVQITTPDDQLVGVRTPAIKGQRDARQALRELLAGTGLRVISDNGAVIVLHRGGEGASPPAEIGAPAESTVEPLTVTGTLLPNIEPLTPVTTISGQQMLDQGYTKLEDLVTDLPEDFKGGIAPDVNPVSGGGQYASNNYGFVSSANLFGLGPDATLTLLNGRRLAPTARGSSVDLSQIPVSAIERVEVLTDGASATYGADAVAGVVNIITKSDFSGFETGLRANGLSDGKGPNYGGNLLGGYDWSTGNILINYDYEHDEPLLASKRPFSSVSYPTGSVNLLPAQSSSNVLVSLRQEFTPALTASINATYNGRIYANAYEPGSGAYSYTNSGNSRILNVGGQISYAFSPDWKVSLIGQYSKEHDFTDVDYFSFGVNFPETIDDSVTSEELRLNGNLLHLPGGEVKFSVGAFLQQEQFRDDDIGSTGGGGQAALVTSDRHSQSVYGEMLLPLVSPDNNVPFINLFQIDVSGRFDHYSVFGSTTNPKYSLQWKPIPDLSFHASFSTSYIAPTLYQASTAQQFLYEIPVVDPYSPSGSTVVLAEDGTNPNLKPETSKNYSIGVKYDPNFIPGLDVSLNYFNINYQNRIDELCCSYFYNIITSNALGSLLNISPTQSEINNLLHSGRFLYVYGPNFSRLPNPYPTSDIGAIANIGTVNAASLQVEGLDMKAVYRHDLWRGRLTLQAAGIYYTRYDQKITPSSPAQGIINTTNNPLRFRGNANAGWADGAWSFNVRVNYSNAYIDSIAPNCGGQFCPIGSLTTVDLAAGYNFAKDYSVAALRGVRGSVQISDLFNKYPPEAPSQIFGYDASNASPLGRTIGFSLTKRW